MGEVETILEGGVFPTAPAAEAIAIGGGKIIEMGRREEILPLAGDGTQRFELAGKTILPGFIDSHTHLLQTGLAEISFTVELSGLSRKETLAALAAACRARGEGEPVIGRGWDESNWKDKTYLSREELDRVSRANPIIAARVDGHLLAANGPAFKLLPSHVDRRMVDEKTGLIREEAAFGLLQGLTPDEKTMEDALFAAARRANQMGITSVHTMLPPNRIRPYMRTRRRLPLRVTLYPEVSALGAVETVGITSGFGDDWLRIGGIKIFADGSIGAGNAALSKPYVGTSEYGGLNYSDEELAGLLRRAEEAGLQTAIHAIGDRAIEQVLRAHAAVGTSAGLRHRIEHFELPTAAQIEQAKELGICVSMQPNFVANWSGEGKMYERRLGKARDRRIDPHRLVLDAGIPLSFGSDCMPLSPLYGLHAAVNAPYPAQRVSVEEGIAAYTQAGAYLSGEEEAKGRLSPGLLADLVVLDADPRSVPAEISDLRVEMTFVGGKLVYSKKENA